MKHIPWVLGLLVLGGAVAAGAEPEPLAVPVPVQPLPPAPMNPAPAVPVASEPAGRVVASPTFQPYWGPAEPDDAWGHRLWVNNEYLLWWMKKGPLPVPIITASNAADVGTIGAPSTQVLFGGQGLDYGAFSGYRLGFGGWVDWERTIGVESRWLFLERRSVVASVVSDPAGNPTFAIPVFDPRPSGSLLFGDQPVGAALPGEAGLFITSAGDFAGGIVASSSSHLWGAEVNALCNLVRNPVWNLNALAGFRHLSLAERIDVRTTALGLAGAGTFVNTLFLTRDRFKADNDFYGGQLGLQAGVQHGRWSAIVSGQLALGATDQLVSRRGSTHIRNSGDPTLPSGDYPGGMLAVATNTGRVRDNPFTVIPELQFQIGYALCRAVQLYAGYTFLYWNNVVRPGEQIDRVVNPTQVPSFGGLGLVGPVRPAPIFQQTDFWAQGVNFGIALQF